MTMPGKLLTCFGTSEVIKPLQQIVVGDMSYRLGPDCVRNLCWKGQEVIRAITWPIRDADWGTMRPVIISENTRQSETDAHHQLHFQVGDGALDCQVSIQCQGTGELQASIEMQASADFPTNRAGFTVLHPITGVAGSHLHVTHGDGSVEQTQFPTLISPDQPVMDIVGLQHELHGVGIDIHFDGEVFEMEDQRNWSDASYKTYCVPLVHPFTYTLARGESRRQTITVRLSGGKSPNKSNTDTSGLALVALDGLAPQIGLALDADWAVTAQTQELVAHCAVQFMLARLRLENVDTATDELQPWSVHKEQALDLEIVIPDATPLSELTQLADVLRRSGIRPAHVIALPEPYLASYQPSGPWPAGPTPDDALQASREAFPDAATGAGVLTNFTELNRCPPANEQWNYISHGNTAIVHAADDQSVMETLEALPQIFTSTQALSHSRPCRLGLVSIGARTNPYGSAPAANPEQIRLALAQADPRQRGLFAAAWAVGVLSTTSTYPIEAITLASPAGPFGMVWQAQEYPQPGFDDEADARLFPLFHIVRAAAAMSSHPRIGVDALPVGIAAYGVKTDDEYRLLLANTSTEPCSMPLGEPWHSRLLDTHTFTDAIRDPLWLENSTARHSDTQTHQPYATAFMTRLHTPDRHDH